MKINDIKSITYELYATPAASTKLIASYGLGGGE